MSESLQKPIEKFRGMFVEVKDEEKDRWLEILAKNGYEILNEPRVIYEDEKGTKGCADILVINKINR